MAEKEGFEPSKPFWGLHDFQSCALGQLRDFSIPFFSSSVATDWDIILQTSQFVNRYFKFFQKFFLQHSLQENREFVPLRGVDCIGPLP